MQSDSLTFSSMASKRSISFSCLTLSVPLTQLKIFKGLLRDTNTQKTGSQQDNTVNKKFMDE